MVPLKTVHGENKAWEIISTLSPEDICKRAGVSYDPLSGLFTVKSFGIDFFVSPAEKRIFSDSPGSPVLLETLRDFFNLSILWYLVTSKDVPATGRLIKPIDIKGGQRFFAGTHTLPLDKLAEKYGKDREGFIKKGAELGAETSSYGDVCLKLFPLPRVPVFLVLWLEDEEFPSRADLLFDSSCNFQIETSDIIWAIAMMSILVML